MKNYDRTINTLLTWKVIRPQTAKSLHTHFMQNLIVYIHFIAMYPIGITVKKLRSNKWTFVFWWKIGISPTTIVVALVKNTTRKKSLQLPVQTKWVKMEFRNQFLVGKEIVLRLNRLYAEFNCPKFFLCHEFDPNNSWKITTA